MDDGTSRASGMSYCRWSDHGCDVYCYADIRGGYTTHVASNHVVKGERKPVGLSHDGKSFNEPDLTLFLSRLLYLKDVGYGVPDFVIQTVREEIAEEAKAYPQYP